MRNILLMSVAMACLAACGGGNGTGPTPTPTTGPTPTPTTAPTPPPAASFTLKRVGSGSYTALAFLPDGRAIFLEQDGTVRVGDPESTPPVIGKLPIFYVNNSGLNDVAVDPGFATNGIVYFSLSEGTSIADVGIAVVKAKIVTSGGTASLTDVTTIWRGEHTSVLTATARIGGAIAVAPDGLIYLGIGDFGEDKAAQDLSNTRGKVIRITNTGAPAPGNPFASRAGAKPEIFSYGHSYPRGMHVGSDGRVYETEIFGGAFDEVNVIEAGKNYGWPLVAEGPTDTTYPPHSSNPAYTAPFFLKRRTEGFGGIIMVRGTQDGWQNQLLLASFEEDGLLRLILTGTGVTEATKIGGASFVSKVAEAPNGRIYAIESNFNGDVLRVDRN